MSAKWFAPRTILSLFNIGKLTCLEHGQNKPWHCKIPNTSKNYWIQVFLFHEKGMGITSPSPFVMLWEVFHPKSCFHVEIFNLQGPTLWKCLGERTTWDVSDDVWWIVWIVVGKKNCGSFGMMQNLVSRYFCHLGRTLMKPGNRMDDDKTTLFVHFLVQDEWRLISWQEDNFVVLACDGDLTSVWMNSTIGWVRISGGFAPGDAGLGRQEQWRRL